MKFVLLIRKLMHTMSTYPCIHFRTHKVCVRIHMLVNLFGQLYFDSFNFNQHCDVAFVICTHPYIDVSDSRFWHVEQWLKHDVRSFCGQRILAHLKLREIPLLKYIINMYIYLLYELQLSLNHIIFALLIIFNLYIYISQSLHVYDKNKFCCFS